MGLLQRIIPAVVLVALPVASASAALNYATPASLYTENFDSRVNSQQANVALTWADDSTIPGWYAYETGGGTTAGFTTAGGATTTELQSGLANGFAAATTFWRSVTGTSPNQTFGTDVAFGTQNFNGTTGIGQSLIYGFALVNTTGSTLNTATFSYNAELWSTNNTATVADGPAVSYAFGATGVADTQGTWNATSWGTSIPTTTTTVNTAGTLVSNSVSNLGWAPGTTLWIRFVDTNATGNDRGVGVDDIKFAADVPEPTTLAAISLAGLLGLRRRQRA